MHHDLILLMAKERHARLLREAEDHRRARQALGTEDASVTPRWVAALWLAVIAASLLAGPVAAAGGGGGGGVALVM
jgi:hypothetical protein